MTRERRDVDGRFDGGGGGGGWSKSKEEIEELEEMEKDMLRQVCRIETKYTHTSLA